MDLCNRRAGERGRGMRTVFWNELKVDLSDLAEKGPEAVAKRDASKNGTGLSVEKGAAPRVPGSCKVLRVLTK